MADWSPEQYERFAGPRTRPALELLNRVSLDAPGRVVDIGCGSGTSTELLAQRWSTADLAGVDNSPAMLAKAAERVPSARFIEADAAMFAPDAPVDVIFSNACLHWLADHGTLLPRYLSHLAPGGVLAVQMPDNLEEPCSQAAVETAVTGPWSAKILSALSARSEIASVDAYYDILMAGGAREVDIWKTVYAHVMDGPDAILQWFRSTGLKPFLDPLNEVEKAAFEAAYLERVTAAYPRRMDGKVLLHFPRLFFVATV